MSNDSWNEHEMKQEKQRFTFKARPVVISIKNYVWEFQKGRMKQKYSTKVILLFFGLFAYFLLAGFNA